MFVPTPPQVTVGAGMAATGANVPSNNAATGVRTLTLATTEAHNTLFHPEGPEWQLVVGEGTYVLRDDLHLATPPLHPTELAAANNNPLATTIPPLTAGTQVSLVGTSSRRPASKFYHLDSAWNAIPSFANYSLKDGAASANGEKEARTSHETGSSDDATSSQPTSTGEATGLAGSTKAPAFGAGNILLGTPVLPSKDASKRRKPKTNMAKTNSSFISRYIAHDQFSKRLQSSSGSTAEKDKTKDKDRDKDREKDKDKDREKDADREKDKDKDKTEGKVAFANASTDNPEGPGALYAIANINRALLWLDLTAGPPWTKADALARILFTKAHILSHDINQITKSAHHLDVVAGSSAADIVWYEPVSQRYNRINKNGTITEAAVTTVRWIPGSESLFLAAHADGTLIVYDKERDDAAFVSEEPRPSDSSEHSQETSRAKHATRLEIRKSVNSKNQKANPVALWKLTNQRINAFAFSPDARHLAVISEDGMLRVIDYLKETLLDIYTSYYGGLICVCWSPDGKYILTGGQDDLVSIWSLVDRQLVARCPGHHSWVTAVTFDPWRCDDENYRFGSVGDDCRLLLWDFNAAMLHKPRAALMRHRGSISSHIRSGSDSLTALRLRSNSSLTTRNIEDEDSIEHAVESRTRTAELPPVLSKIVDPHPLSWLGFQEDCIMTACSSGHIRTWDRPTEPVNESRTTLAGVVTEFNR